MSLWRRRGRGVGVLVSVALIRQGDMSEKEEAGYVCTLGVFGMRLWMFLNEYIYISISIWLGTLKWIDSKANSSS